MEATHIYKFEVSVPQLEPLGVTLMASLTAIAEALGRLEATVTTELGQIAEALRANPTEAEVQALADRVDAVSTTVANIIPETPPQP